MFMHKNVLSDALSINEEMETRKELNQLYKI